MVSKNTPHGLVDLNIQSPTVHISLGDHVFLQEERGEEMNHWRLA